MVLNRKALCRIRENPSLDPILSLINPPLEAERWLGMLMTNEIYKAVS
jgi:hypothetical protein